MGYFAIYDSMSFKNSIRDAGYAYDLTPDVPEAVAAVALFLAGCFCLGWAAVARWFGRCPETEPFLAVVDYPPLGDDKMTG
jgi:hypothetical protein